MIGEEDLGGKLSRRQQFGRRVAGGRDRHVHVLFRLDRDHAGDLPERRKRDIVNQS
jgi:hypothetical protein